MVIHVLMLRGAASKLHVAEIFQTTVSGFELR